MVGDRIKARWLLVAALGVVALVLAVGAAACGDDEEDGGDDGATATPTEDAAAAIPEVEVGALDFSFTAPSSISGGLTRFTLNNTGAEPHQLQFVRLNDGVTFEQFQEAVGQPDPSGAIALVSFAGGPNTVDPGQSAEAASDLQPGAHVLLCFVSGDDGIPHLAKGMIRQMEVTEAPVEAPDPPETDASVTASDFAFDAPATLPAGEVAVEFANAGLQPHELTVMRLTGITVDQARELFTGDGAEPAGPPPVENAAGVSAVAPNTTSYTTLNLTAGDYVLVCFVPDPSDGQPHVALGMFDSFTVE